MGEHKRPRPAPSESGDDDPIHAAAGDELRLGLPAFAVIYPTSLGVQAVRLPDGRPGVAIRAKNAVFEIPWAMTLEDARTHIDSVEAAILETRVVPPQGPSVRDVVRDARGS